MGHWELSLRLAGGILLTLANAFFVVTEFALTRLPQLDPAEDEDGLQRARSMTERLEIYLTGCQLGITTSSILLGVVAEPAFTWLLRPVLELIGIPAAIVPGASVVLAVVVINLIHKVWGEQTPTYLGVERPRQVARYAAPLLQAWTTAAYPFIIAGDGIAKWTLRLFGIQVQRSWTKEEKDGAGDSLDTVADVRREMGNVLSRTDLSEERRAEVLRALEIERTPVRDILVPREKAVALTTTASLEENLERMRSHRYNRYPLIGASWDEVRGIVYLPAVFQELNQLQDGQITLADIAHPPMTVQPDLSISDLIDRFQEENHELAIVAEEDGAVIGLVTATDTFEAIAGELEDPIDEEMAQ